MIILGIDPGLRHAGWGVIAAEGTHIKHIANGRIDPPKDGTMEERLCSLHEELSTIITQYQPDEVAIEETFVNKNPASALKLGMARGVLYMTPATFDLTVTEYPANTIKKSIVGSGHASKEQMQMMVKTLLPQSDAKTADAADALAIAICHYHHRGSTYIQDQLAG